jgi:hypothetical protein
MEGSGVQDFYEYVVNPHIFRFRSALMGTGQTYCGRWHPPSWTEDVTTSAYRFRPISGLPPLLDGLRLGTHRRKVSTDYRSWRGESEKEMGCCFHAEYNFL